MELITIKKAVPFHQKICKQCHTVPRFKEWLEMEYLVDLSATIISKRTGNYKNWEPIYIGTRDEPAYDERLSWNGKSDKMTQSYIMCLLDYEYHLLDNAFLVHKFGIKTIKEATRTDLEIEAKLLIHNTIKPEINFLYGNREEC